MGTLICNSCGKELVRNDDLFLYHPVRTEGHLAIKFERTEELLNEATGPFLIRPIDSSETENTNLIKAANINCKNCDAIVAFKIFCGPNHDSLICISMKATHHIMDDGSILSNSSLGGAPRRKNLLKQFLDERDITEFYGSKMNLMKSNSLVGPLIHPTVEDLNELEMDLLVKDRPRSYQIECFCAASMFSSIIQIPTGAGKTHISAMLTALYKRLNPNRMVWFLTDRIPLVFQQALYIENQTSLTVLPLAGDVQTNLRPSQLIKYDVMVCTVQLLINMLIIGQIRVDDVSLVIIDEIHHAVRNHPYVVFIETFLSKRSGNERPRLLGLTASPAAGAPIQMKLQLRELSRLCAAQLYTPCIYRSDLASAVNRPSTKYIPVSLSFGDSKLFQVLFENIHKLLIDESCPCSNLEEVRMNLRGLTVKSRQDHKLAAKLFRVHHFLTALEMTSILGSKYSRAFLIDLLKPSSDGGLDEKPLTPHEAKILEICEEEDQERNVSPKAQALCKLLESIDLETTSDTRMIIFVETKRTARWLASFLQDYLSSKGLTSWNPTAFTGQSSNSVDGMSWKSEQRPILALFRSGHVKLLIATSVLQEGLDVAACNHIVLFDRTWSLKSFLQSRGRARAQDSEYTIICSVDDKNYYEKLFQQEILLSKMVRDEMVDGEVLSLESTMQTILLNVKCSKLDFSRSCPNLVSSDGLLALPNANGESDEDEEDESEYILTLNLHNSTIENSEGPCQLNLIEIERRRDHFPFLAELEQISVSIELPAISLKSIKRSWIQLSEELLDPLINERFPDALIELDRIIPDLIAGSVADGSHSFIPFSMEMQKFSAGILDSGNKFIESASQHHSFTPTMSQIVFDSLSRRISILFQESLDKTFRIDIAYDKIDSFCLIARNPASDESNFSLILPLKTAPLLHVSTDDVTNFEIEKKIGDVHWERVTSNCFNERLNGVFPSCPSIKIDLFLNGMTSRKLFQILRKLGSNILYTCNLEMESFPEFHSIWLMRTEKFLNNLDFETQYRLRSVISETWSKTSLRLSQDWLERAASVAQGVLNLFTKKLSANRFIDPCECLEICLENFKDLHDKPEHENIQGALSVKLVTWTPSRIYHHSPTIFLSNRVLREFGADNFIRVHFRDEDFLKLSVIRSNSSIDNLLEVGVRGCLDDGIVIGGRKFEFLAMSSSQLRGHSCWFVDEKLGADQIRSWLGSFEEIRNVAKYVARLGQSFSASKPTVTVSSFDAIPDWVNNGHCFSDGCGVISVQLAQEIASKLNLLEIPSAFQIRFAGFKGVVSVSPEISGLALRPSMKKFETHHRSLDVLNISVAFPCFLNRQIIMILSALGVPDSVFETLQLNHLKYLAECFNSHGKLSLNHLNISHLDPMDPFMRSLISAQYRQQLAELLTKTRISVPNGRILMGVVDETGTLAADEIFCQIKDDRLFAVIDGDIVVAKNPCMHPGDVRVLKAVRNSRLEVYSQNVVVFSRQGTRPVPNMCSGSDLDGDLYFISWDQSLIPPQVDEPMKYDGLAANVKNGPITSDDLKEFMVFFIKNDKLGVIANTHVAFADQFKEGVRDPACMALAKLFSFAVDFPKTGYIAEIPKEIRIEKYPDFMQKSDVPSYASHRIIGKLFREIKAIMNEEIPEDSYEGIPINKELLTPGYQEYIEVSRRLYENYATDIGQCLTQYGLKQESHLLMACTIAMDVSIREMNSDALEIADVTFKHHLHRYREIFESLMQGKDDECRRKFNSAWYYVSYSDPITPIGLEVPILSFPWIIQDLKYKNQIVPESSNSLIGLIAEDLKNWFVAPHETESSESTNLIDSLSQNLFFLNQIEGILSDSSKAELKVCLKEFLITGQIILTFPSINLITGKILKAFPSAVVQETSDSVNITIEATSLTIVKEDCASISDRRKEFSSQLEYIKSYLCFKLSAEYPIDLYTKMTELAVCSPFESFGALVSVKEIPKALRNWMNWILSGHEIELYKEISRGMIESLDQMIRCDESESRINLLRIQHCLMRTCSIKATLKAMKSFKTGGLKTSIIRTILKNPRILRQITSKSSILSPTGNGIYVQGASKLIFNGSNGEGDLLRFEIYDGRRLISHLTRTCYKVSLKTPQILGLGLDSFAFNEFWTHLHRQFHYLRKFGGSEYGKLQASIKIGRIYATELPRMFMEQPVSIWIARVALDKSFKFSKWGRRKTRGVEFKEIDFDNLKCNPRNDSTIEESISSDRVTQSLQTLLETAESGTKPDGKDDKKASSPSKKSKSFGNMSTGFEPVVSEEIAKKFLKLGQFKVENTLHLSLTCYDEASNTNTAFQLHYNEANELISVGQRNLRWAVIDVLSENSSDSGDLRISLNSFNSRNENLDSIIFSNGIIEKSEGEGNVFRVKDDFKANPTIYLRCQEGYSKSLREDFTLIVRKITESIGVDPISGHFAISQEKWEIEAKIDLDWNEIHDYQYRDQLILTLWEISRRFK